MPSDLAGRIRAYEFWQPQRYVCVLALWRASKVRLLLLPFSFLCCADEQSGYRIRLATVVLPVGAVLRFVSVRVCLSFGETSRAQRRERAGAFAGCLLYEREDGGGEQKTPHSLLIVEYVGGDFPRKPQMLRRGSRMRKARDAAQESCQ